jgi:tetratricopeptide (TPR) repeat protein
MSKYNLEINYLLPSFDISREELLEIIAEADRIITETTETPEKMAEAHLKKSQCLQKLGRDEESKEPIQKALALFPDMVEALVQLGNIYNNEKKYDDALATYNRAVQINPGYAAAFTNRGNAYSRKEKYEKALADYTEAIRLKPDNVIAFINRSVSYDKTGEYAKADWDEGETIRLQPDLLPGLDYLHNVENTGEIVAFSSSNNWVNDEMREEINRDIKALTGALSLRPNNADFYFRRALNYDRLGEYDKAIGDWTDVIRLKPEHSRDNPFEYRGDAYSRKGDYERAIADYTESIRIHPNRIGTLKKRGDTYEILGQHDRAAADRAESNRLEQKIKNESDRQPRWYIANLVDLVREAIAEKTEELEEVYLEDSLRFFHIKEEQNGRKCLVKALDICSVMNQEESKQPKATLAARITDIARRLDDKIAHWSDDIDRQPEKAVSFLNNRGVAYAKKADYGKVLVEWARALEVDVPTGEWFQNYEADYKRAVFDFTEAIGLKNAKPYELRHLYQNRGRLYIDLKQYKNAIVDFTEALYLRPQWTVDYSYSRGIVHDDKGDYEKSIADYTDTIHLRSKLAGYYLYGRGIALDGKGDYENAIVDYTEATKSGNTFVISNSLYNRGLVYDKIGEYEKAVSDYTAAIRLAGERPFVSALHNRCLIYKTIGQSAKAEVDFLRLRSTDKDYREVATRCPRRGINLYVFSIDSIEGNPSSIRNMGK